jgi:nucleotide-binding universal stress UspA family protein
MYGNILIPTDGSPLSAEAVEKSMGLAKEIGAKVTVLSVTEPLRLLSLETNHIARMLAEYSEAVSKQSRWILKSAEQKAKDFGVPCETLAVEHPQPYEAIIATAREKGCDLIAMASHGRRGISAVVLGSETLKVLTHSKMPVLVYR